jgi:hypothetical protein
LVNTPVEVDKISSIFEKDKKPSIIYTGRNEILFICDVLSQRKPKKFLFLSRRWTIDRFFTFLDLRRRNILDNSIYSFSLSSNPYGFAPEYVDEVMLDGTLISHVESYGKTNPYANDIVDYWFTTKHDILNEIPRSLGDIFKDQYNSSIVDAFNSTYMSLCVETATMMSDGMHFQPSEKIYKCCYHRHPFVVYTTPKFLSYWKDSNYKSFSSIINEDYDNKWNCIERTQFINDEIQKLNEMPFQHFHQLTTWACASELTHNQIEIVRKFGNLSAKNYPTNTMVQDIFTKTPLDYNPHHIP